MFCAPRRTFAGPQNGYDNQFWITQKETHMRQSENKTRRMKALANSAGVIAAAAMDQRGSLQKSLAAAKGVDKKLVTDEMMSEFKTAVTKVLTPHASAILLDPEWGLPAAKARSKNAGLLLAYEASGYDNTQPGRLQIGRASCRER